MYVSEGKICDFATSASENFWRNFHTIYFLENLNELHRSFKKKATVKTYKNIATSATSAIRNKISAPSYNTTILLLCKVI